VPKQCRDDDWELQTTGTAGLGAASKRKQQERDNEVASLAGNQAAAPTRREGDEIHQ